MNNIQVLILKKFRNTVKHMGQQNRSWMLDATQRNNGKLNLKKKKEEVEETFNMLNAVFCAFKNLLICHH